MNDLSSQLLARIEENALVPVGLVALVVTHNRQAQLRVTLDRLLAEQVDVIVVVNNASTDGTGDLLRAVVDPRLYVITLARNMGGAGGFEAGLRTVRARFDPDWCVLTALWGSLPSWKRLATQLSLPECFILMVASAK